MWCNNYSKRHYHDYFIREHKVVEAYKCTKPGSPLRKLLAIAFALQDIKDYVDIRNSPAQFLIDVWTYAAYINVSSEPAGDLKPCDFHEHDIKMDHDSCVVRVKMDRHMK